MNALKFISNLYMEGKSSSLGANNISDTVAKFNKKWESFYHFRESHFITFVQHAKKISNTLKKLEMDY
jgi:hypothetical protein